MAKLTHVEKLPDDVNAKVKASFNELRKKFPTMNSKRLMIKAGLMHNVNVKYE